MRFVTSYPFKVRHASARRWRAPGRCWRTSWPVGDLKLWWIMLISLLRFSSGEAAIGRDEGAMLSTVLQILKEKALMLGQGSWNSYRSSV